jgi:starch synthase
MAKKPTSKKNPARKESTTAETTTTTTKRAGSKAAASKGKPASRSGTEAAAIAAAPAPRTSAKPLLHRIRAGEETAALRPMPRVHEFARREAPTDAAAVSAPPEPMAEPALEPTPEQRSKQTPATAPTTRGPGQPVTLPPGKAEPAPTPESRSESGYEPEPKPHPEPQHEPPPAPASHQHRPSLFIVHVTPEMAPVAKVGGLADVVFGLSRELAIRGNHVEIILPKYDTLRYDHIFELHEVYRDLWVPWYEGAVHCTVYFGFVHDRKCFFIEPHSHDNFFNRGSIYGFVDDVLRYAFFSRAAMEFLWKAGKHPDIIHCHDWQTALVPVFLYEFYQKLGMTHPRACLTIHNFKHQGVTGVELLRATGLHQPERFFDRVRMGDNQHKDALNLLKAGVVYSNFVTTVSPRYAFETKDGGQGFGLEPTLHTHHMKYGGVVNGVDYDVWNPEVDHHLPVRYGADNIDAKYDNKRALRHRLMLADNEKPIVAFIGRLDPQKGLELVRHAIFYALERGAQFVLLGSSPHQEVNNDFWGLKHMLNDSPDCHLEIGFDEDLAHLIYAGADIILVPSQFEPCGLTQLIALRYGTIPVVRTVGGLADTVFDKDHSDRPLHERNGYRFDNYDGPGLESALGRAIDCYYQYPEHFRELMKNAMRSDYSWNRPGQDYLNIYDFIRNR